MLLEPQCEVAPVGVHSMLIVIDGPLLIPRLLPDRAESDIGAACSGGRALTDGKGPGTDARIDAHGGVAGWAGAY